MCLDKMYFCNESLHMYEVQGMEKYIPKDFYSGRSGYIQSFLDGISSILFTEIKLKEMDSQIKNLYLKMNNTARDMVLLENKNKLIRKKMRWLVRKIWNEVREDYEIQKDKMIFFKIHVKPKYFNESGITIRFYTIDGNFDYTKEYSLNLEEYKEVLEKYFTQNKCDSKIKLYCILLCNLYDKYVEPLYRPEYDIYEKEIEGDISTYFGSKEGFIEIDT